MSICKWKLFEYPIAGLKQSLDYVAINHYTILFASINPFDWSGRKECPVLLSNFTRKFDVSDFQWTLIPESLGMTLFWVQQRWNEKNLPIVVSEHGIADKTDSKRPGFTTGSLAWLKYYMEQEKLPVTKYLHWSLTDNYEWAEGYTQHFGLVAVNMETQERTCRGTCEILSQIARDKAGND
jgi:beta-glucosidase/6-phospho-beta-glucosidase/beta-galactosidase